MENLISLLGALGVTTVIGLLFYISLFLGFVTVLFVVTYLLVVNQYSDPLDSTKK